MHVKKILFFLLFCTFLTGAPARTALYENESYTLKALFPQEVHQGDPVFLKLIITLKEKKPDIEVQASMNIRQKDSNKSISSHNLYLVSQSDSSVVLFAGSPLSTYVKEGEYNIYIEYSAGKEPSMFFTLPLTILNKEFIKETLALNDVNTAIKTDISGQRMNQIRVLNALLARKDDSALYSDGSFILPTTITRRTSYFGDRRTYTYTSGESETSLHYGIDFGTPLDTPVYACGRGKVVMAELRISTGWTVVIEHLPGLYSLYYHLNALHADTGQIVETGQKIGLSGNTGLSTGPHLHWEMRLLGEAVNPDFFTQNFSHFFE